MPGLEHLVYRGYRHVPTGPCVVYRSTRETEGLSRGQGPPLDLTSLTFTPVDSITYGKSNCFTHFNSDRYITYV